MRAALIVAGRDLRALARARWAWGLIAGAVLTEGLAFHAVALGVPGPRRSAEVLARALDVMGAAALVVALVVGARAIAGERERGTLAVLTGGPASAATIVTGKFLAGLAPLGLVLVASIHLPALIAVRGSVSPGHVAVGLLGVGLLGAASLAVALAASCLARSQVGAIATAALALGMIALAGPLGRVLDAPWGPLLEATSLFHAHQRPFLRGVVRLEGVVVHLAVVATALAAAARALAAGRWS